MYNYRPSIYKQSLAIIRKMTLKRTVTGTPDGTFPLDLSHLSINGGKGWKVIGRTVYLCEQTNQILLLQAEPHVSTLWLVAVHFFFFLFFFF